jgi:FkbM family methyltransferase
MLVDAGDLIGRELAVAGVWEPHVTAVFRALLRNDDVCVDVGAHTGYFTLLASRLVGPSGHVYAVEPAADQLAQLELNLRRNGIRNVTVFRTAAAAADGEAILYEGRRKNRGEASLRPIPAAGGATATVPTRRLDTLLPDAMWPAVRLVKIDVEHHELEVLRGLSGLLDAGWRPAIVVEVGRSNATVLCELADAYGLTAYRLPRPRLLSGEKGRTMRLEPLSEPLAEQEEVLLAP